MAVRFFFKTGSLIVSRLRAFTKDGNVLNFESTSSCKTAAVWVGDGRGQKHLALSGIGLMLRPEMSSLSSSDFYLFKGKEGNNSTDCAG